MTAAKKAKGKAVRMWALVYPNGKIFDVCHFRANAIAGRNHRLPSFVLHVVPVIVTPAKRAQKEISK